MPSHPQQVLIVGASRGLGYAMVEYWWNII